MQETTQEQETQKETEKTVVELTPLQQKAAEQGWKPKEEWVAEGKDPDEWRDAKEYVERGELFNLIDSQKKELKQVRKVLDKFKEHHLKVRETAYEEALRTLKAQLKQAKEAEDFGAVLELNDKILELRDKKEEEITNAKKELEDSPVNDEGLQEKFAAWAARNPWYKQNGVDKVSAYAEKVGAVYRKENPDVPFDDFLRHIEKKVKEEFPELFKAPKKGSGVEGAGETRSKAKTDDDYPMTETEIKIMNTLVKSGAITKEQYIKDLKAYDDMKGVKRD